MAKIFLKISDKQDKARLENATQELAQVLKKLDKQGRIGGPIEDQLSD